MVYAPAEVTMFFSADIPRNRLEASLFDTSSCSKLSETRNQSIFGIPLLEELLKFLSSSQLWKQIHSQKIKDLVPGFLRTEGNNSYKY